MPDFHPADSLAAWDWHQEAWAAAQAQVEAPRLAPPPQARNAEPPSPTVTSTPEGTIQAPGQRWQGPMGKEFSSDTMGDGPDSQGDSADGDADGDDEDDPDGRSSASASPPGPKGPRRQLSASGRTRNQRGRLSQWTELTRRD